MKLTENIIIVNFKLTKDVLNTLLKFDEDNQKINFPNDLPNPEVTKERIKKEYMEEKEGHFLVKDGKKIIGCLFLKTRYNPYRRCKYGDIRNIYLIEEYRGKGMGKKLLSFADEYFCKKGCKYIFLGTSYYNAISIKVYKSVGYIESRLIMEKMLEK